MSRMIKLQATILLAQIAVGWVVIIGCAPAREAATTISSIAQALCRQTLARPEQRQQLDPALRDRTASLAVDDLCALDEVIAPFIDGLLAAQRSAASRLRSAPADGLRGPGGADAPAGSP